MTFVRDLGLGFSGFFRAFGFAMNNRMGWFFLVPVVLWAALAFGLLAALKGPVDRSVDRLGDRFGVPVEAAGTDAWSSAKAILLGAPGMFIGLVLKLAMAYLLYVLTKYIVLVLLSPLLAHASERTEELITGHALPFSWGRLVRDALRGALIAARNGVMELSFSICIWLLTLFVPVLAPVSFILLFIVSAYFYGFGMFDYVFERRYRLVGERVNAVNDRIGAVLANGALFSLLMKVPLLGVMFAPVLAAIGAVLVVIPQQGAMITAGQRPRS